MPFRFWTWGRKTPTPPPGNPARNMPPPKGRFNRESGDRPRVRNRPPIPLTLAPEDELIALTMAPYEYGTAVASGKVPSSQTGKWTPKYADFADTSEQGKQIPLGGSDLSSPGWFAAPMDSHVHSFSFLDPRYDEYWKTYGGGTQSGRATLMVRFKPSRAPLRPRHGHAPYNVVTEYWYHFSDPARGLRIFEDMQAADHPGKIVWNDLIRGRVPYERKF